MAEINTLPRWAGARVARIEDPRLLAGRGRYVDDIDLPGMLHVAFVRSVHASARIVAIRTDGARTAPGVHAVWTGEDIAVRLQKPDSDTEGQPALADGWVRYVGEPVAAVVAESRYLAEDAAELIEVEYEAIPPVLDMRESLSDRSEHRVHPRVSNVFQHKEYQTPGFDAAFEHAAHHLAVTFQTHRQTAVSIEPRGTAAALDPASGRLTIYASIQSPHRFRGDMAELLGIELHRLRVVVPEVGGSFGMKANAYPEDVVVAMAAIRLRQPVKWVSDRMEAFLSDVHARDDIHDLEVAFEDDGRIVAVRDHLMADGGAYTAFPFSGADGETNLASKLLTGPYRVDHLSTTIDCVYSNKTPLGAYRGVWGPIASFVQEGMVDRVARALDMDPVAVRRVNLLRSEDFPYLNPAGKVYDAGTYLESMETALEMVDYAGFRRRQAAEREQGRHLGIGVSVFVEPTAMARSEAGSTPYEAVTVRVEPTGTVTAAVGLGPSGQGHETVIAQLLADQLGISPDRITVLHGDTDSAPFGGGTGGSRSGPIGGGASIRAGRAMRKKIEDLAAHLLEADVNDIRFEGGAAWVAGVPARSIGLAELANIAYTDVGRLPDTMEPGLEVTVRYRPQASETFSNGTHIAVVEVDVATGLVRVLDYAVANDCGEIINPMIVEGQIHGGVAQGIGSALMEELIFDAGGQLTTTTLLDYRLPQSTDVPPVRVTHLTTPSSGEGGIKGMAEGSLIASPAAVAGAVNDALAPFGIAFAHLPIRPQDIVERVAES